MAEMSVASSRGLLEFLLLGGLAFWMTLAVVNNMVDFRGGVGAIGHLMNMESLRQPPTGESALLSRAVGRAGWHRFVMALTLLFEIGSGLLLWWATLVIAGSTWGRVDPGEALVVVNLALAALIALLFFFLLGGTWFVYYVKQESLQISHVAMLALAVGAAVLCNAG